MLLIDAIESPLDFSSDLKKARTPVELIVFVFFQAYFPLGDFVRATRSENKYPTTLLVKIGWRKNSPRTSRNRSYFFGCSL